MPGLRAKPSSPSGKRTTRCHSFHLDHIASLPYLTEKTNFKGKVFMTHASKAIGLLLIKDYVRVRYARWRHRRRWRGAVLM